MNTVDVLPLLHKAVELHRQGHLPQAIAVYQDVLQHEPKNADVLHLVGAACFQQGRFGEAGMWLHRALEANPEAAPTHDLLALTLRELGRREQALASAERAVTLAPDVVGYAVNHANLLNEMRRFDQSSAAYERILAANPGAASLWHNHSIALFELRRLDAALTSADRAIALEPGNPQYVLQRGNCLRALARYDEAIAAYDSVLATQPTNGTVLLERALALAAAGRGQEAVDTANRANVLMPVSAEARYVSGSVMLSLGDQEQALAHFDRAIALRPDHALSHHMRGYVLQALERQPEALAAFDRALKLSPQSAKLHADRAYTLNLLGRFGDALDTVSRALRLGPAEHDVRATCGVIELLHGRWIEGWDHFESRHHVLTPFAAVPALALPRWNGEPPDGGLLLLVAEQGLGDAIQSSRFATALAAQGHAVKILARPALAQILAGTAGIEGVITSEDELAGETRPVRWLPLMSAARIMRLTPETVPHSRSYLAAPAEQVEEWQTKLGAGGLRIGIAWQGNPAHQRDRTRSMPLASFAPLSAIENVRLISLQKGPGAEQVDSVPWGHRIERPLDAADVGPGAMMQTAALVAALDLVVTCDSMIAHLAGALGRPVFVGVQRVPDWRWLLNRDDSPWYPTMRIFRQTKDGDWSGVFAAMAAAVREPAASRA